MVRYHIKNWQKNSKSLKNIKPAKCQPVAQRRLYEKCKNTQVAIKWEIVHQIDQGKFFLVRNSTKDLDVHRKYEGKILLKYTSQMSRKQSTGEATRGAGASQVTKKSEKNGKPSYCRKGATSAEEVQQKLQYECWRSKGRTSKSYWLSIVMWSGLSPIAARWNSKAARGIALVKQSAILVADAQNL